MDEPVHQTELVKGQTYRVFWKQQAGNYRWYKKGAVWQFLSYEPKQYQPDQLVWSGRPVCGTQEMDVNNFLYAEVVPQDTKCTVPKGYGPYTDD